MFPVSRRFRLSLAAFLVAAPLGEFVETLLSPLQDGSTRDDLRAIEAHQSVFVVSVLVGVVATVLYVPAILGLCRLTWERSRTLTAVAGTLVVFSLLGFMGVRMGQGVELQGIRDGLGVARTARLVDGLAANAIGATIFGSFLAGSIVGLICLAVAVWRAQVAPWPAAVLLLAFPFLDELLPGSLGAVVAHAALLAGLGWIGLAQVRTARPVPAAEPVAA